MILVLMTMPCFSIRWFELYAAQVVSSCFDWFLTVWHQVYTVLNKIWMTINAGTIRFTEVAGKHHRLFGDHHHSVCWQSLYIYIHTHTGWPKSYFTLILFYKHWCISAQTQLFFFYFLWKDSAKERWKREISKRYFWSGGVGSTMVRNLKREIGKMSVNSSWVTFTFAQIPSGKVWIHLFSLPGYNRVVWAIFLWGGNRSRRRKTLNSKLAWRRMGSDYLTVDSPLLQCMQCSLCPVTPVVYRIHDMIFKFFVQFSYAFYYFYMYTHTHLTQAHPLPRNQ